MAEETRREVIRGVSYTRLFKFRDPHGEIAKLSAGGVSTDEIVSEFAGALLEERRVAGNVFLTEGINHLWKLVTGQNVTPFGSNSCIGVGDGVLDEANTQTGLTGANKYYKQVDEDYPRVDGIYAIFRATFGPDEANFAWNEWTVANGCGDEYVNLNRKRANMGTKGADATWILEVMLYIT